MQDPGLAGVQDELAIQRLNARYNWACYERDADAYAACFTPDGVYESIEAGIRNAGREALARALRGAEASPWLMGHVSADPLIDIDGDTATQKVFVILYRRESPAGDNGFYATGHYRDRLVRTEAGWRYAHRTSVIDRTNVPWSSHARP